MFCSKCGNIMRDGTRICPSCGAKQAEQTTRVNTDCDHEHRGGLSPSGTNIGFVDAIKMFFTRWHDFSGRSTRSEYWYAVLAIGLANGVIVSAFSPDSFLFAVWSLITVVPSLALLIRRLHDAGKEGFRCLWLLIPVVGWFIVLMWLCADSEPANRRGLNPKDF